MDQPKITTDKLADGTRVMFTERYVAQFRGAARARKETMRGTVVETMEGSGIIAVKWDDDSGPRQFFKRSVLDVIHEVF